jgi:nicotinamide mononucleotide transporter
MDFGAVDWKLVLQIAGVCLGLLYLWLEYRADIRLWVVGLVMPFIHGVLYYVSGLYADMAMELYYVLAGVYGLVVWSRGAGRGKKGGTGEATDGKTGGGTSGATDGATGGKKEISISHTPLRAVLPLVAVGVAAFGIISFVLVRWTDSTVPYMDAATTAASIVAMWMLSRKWVEQWLVWIAVDVVCCGLYIYKEIPLTGALYGLYAVLAVAGYLRWLRQAKSEE